MRKTPIPLLRDLEPGFDTIILRCQYCNELVFARESCSGPKEAKACPDRAAIDIVKPTTNYYH